MGAPRICVAGINPETMGHVRPVTLRSDLLTRALLRDEGGPIRVASLVDIGAPSHRPSPPEVEDQLIAAADIKLVRDLDADLYLEVVSAVAQTDLEEAFGPELQRHGSTYIIEPDRGRASLAVVEVQRSISLQINSFGKLRLRFDDPEPSAYLSVTDVRFVEADHTTIKRQAVDDVNRRLRSGVKAFVMFGLSRPFEGGADHDVHWLQVNGLCLEDRPLG